MQEYKLRYLPMFYDDFEEIKKMTEDLHFIKTIVAILVLCGSLELHVRFSL